MEGVWDGSKYFGPEHWINDVAISEMGNAKGGWDFGKHWREEARGNLTRVKFGMHFKWLSKRRC